MNRKDYSYTPGGVNRNPDDAEPIETEPPDWMLTADDRLLIHFSENGPTLCPQAAGVLGLHVSFARSRCEKLCDHGFLTEQNTEFSLTDRGQRYIEVTVR